VARRSVRLPASPGARCLRSWGAHHPPRPRCTSAAAGVFGLRRSFAQDLLRIAPEQLCVLAHDVGGSLGRRPRPIPNTSRSCTRRARSAARSNGATSAPTASCWISRGAAPSSTSTLPSTRLAISFAASLATPFRMAVLPASDTVQRWQPDAAVRRPDTARRCQSMPRSACRRSPDPRALARGLYPAASPTRPVSPQPCGVAAPPTSCRRCARDP
jgi:hypothetical protein